MKITESAKVKVAELIDKNKEVMPNESFFLRITAVLDDNDIVKHQVYFDYEKRLEDRLLRFKGFDLRIDEESYVYLKNASLDYSEFEDGHRFFIDNPNSHSHSGENVI
jgi:Fe-S cluster assembly iron-binding protein IscA